jgi:putative endonuclease
MLARALPLRGGESVIKGGYVYILASQRNGTLYVGSAIDLGKRIYEHKIKALPGFTSRYGVDRLVYYEHYPSISEARGREYQLKKWRRAWKLRLIEEMNPNWIDLHETLS